MTSFFVEEGKMLLDGRRHEGAVDDCSFDSLFEVGWNLLRFNIKTLLWINPLLKLFNRQKLSRIAVN